MLLNPFHLQNQAFKTYSFNFQPSVLLTSAIKLSKPLDFICQWILASLNALAGNDRSNIADTKRASKNHGVQSVVENS